MIGLQEVREVPERVPNQAALAGRAAAGIRLRADHGLGRGAGGVGDRVAVSHRRPDVPPAAAQHGGGGADLLSARLDSEAGGLWVHTTHLSFREHEGVWREEQVQFVDEVVTTHKNDNPRMVTGDFNTSPDSDEMRWMTGLHTLAAGGSPIRTPGRLIRDDPGYTWARANDYSGRCTGCGRPAARLHVRDPRPSRSAGHRPRRQPGLDRPEWPTARDLRRTITGSPPTCRLLAEPYRGPDVPPRSRHRSSFSWVRAGRAPRDLMGKRAVRLREPGGQPLRKHKMDLLEALRVDLRAQAPDHLAVTGDLSNVALDGGVARGAGLAGSVGRGARCISVIPGNHDAYIPRCWPPASSSGCSPLIRRAISIATETARHYPFVVHMREPVALMGVTSAVATGDLGAWGAIGEAQLGAARGHAGTRAARAERASCWCIIRRCTRKAGRTATCAIGRPRAVLGAGRRRAGPARA